MKGIVIVIVIGLLYDMNISKKLHDLYCSLRHLIYDPGHPMMCFRCLINGCTRVKKSPFLRAWVYYSSPQYLLFVPIIAPPYH